MPRGFCRLRTRVQHYGLRQGRAQIFVRIDGRIVNANFVVKVGAGAASAGSDVADYIAAVDGFSFGRSVGGHMPEQSRDAVSMIENYRSSIAVDVIIGSDCAVGWCHDGRAERGGDIYPGMECAFTVEGIDALAEGSCHDSFHRPQRRSRSQTLPVACAERAKVAVVGGNSRTGNAGHRGVLQDR